MDIDTDFIKQGKKAVIYTFSTQHLKKTDKIRFYYALKGRDGESGIVKRAKILHLGKGVLLVPYIYDEEVSQFFRVWNLNYTRRAAIVEEEAEKSGLP